MDLLFTKVLNMSISASWLVLAVLLLRLLLKKSPKWISVALWALVALRLVCPYSLESTLSLIPEPSMPSAIVALIKLETEPIIAPARICQNSPPLSIRITGLLSQ